MIIAFVLSIIACAIPSTILLIQIMGSIARNMANRHYDEYTNKDNTKCRQVWDDGYEEIFEISQKEA